MATSPPSRSPDDRSPLTPSAQGQAVPPAEQAVAMNASADQTTVGSAWQVKPGTIALVTCLALAAHLLLRWTQWGQTIVFSWAESSVLRVSDLPLIMALLLGGTPLVIGLLIKMFRGEFGSDLLAGLSIVVAALLGEYLAGTMVVLMLSGGEALEAYAVRRASYVLAALAKRLPHVAHCRIGGEVRDVSLSSVQVGDLLVVLPHETCPVDGTVIEGRGQMDESYLTGEPYVIAKVPGSTVLSGAINGMAALTIRADRVASDSRYAKIMQIMRDSEQRRPRLRRLGDQLGAIYTPLAVALALAAWWASGDATRFLSVLVVATPCPLLIAIPVAIIGSISLAARLGIIIKDPAILERIDRCRTAIFDKTGTLTYGEPRVSDVLVVGDLGADELLTIVASLEQYSKHPLAGAVVREAQQRALKLLDTQAMEEKPGYGLKGIVSGRPVRVTSRKAVVREFPEWEGRLPPRAAGMECLLVIDERPAGLIRFRDEPRDDGPNFISHLRPKHQFGRVMLVSGDRESEVRYLADQVGINEFYFSQSPEQKLEIVRQETRLANTLFLGDGINDAPALTAATVGIAFGQQSDITAEAAGAVIMDSSLRRVDQFFHISRRMRQIALQSAVGGMTLSVVGMLLAASGYLPPVAGALCQEVIDVLAVLNALRAAWPPRSLSDF
jgi:heavy metal translocating P-type ATPase